MDTLTVNLGARSYPIHIGAGVLERAGELLQQAGLRGKVAVITNPTVAQLYLDAIDEALRHAGFEVTPILLPDGEEHKNLRSLTTVYDRLIAERFERKSCLLALGGGVIGDPDLFRLLEEKVEGIVKLDREVLSRIILMSCAIKARVVEADEREDDQRAVLNFGHTIGHALEAATGYQQFLHGEAIGVG